jgi:hypothetical protein
MKEYTKLKYKTNVLADSVHDGQAWCLVNLGDRWDPFGRTRNKWASAWMGWFNEQAVYQFSFAEEKDLIMFKLKFS